MSNPDFAFIPRKLAKAGRDVGDAVKSRKSFHRKPEIPAEPAASSSSTTQDKRWGGKYLEDREYTTLFELALSEHSLWSNQELFEMMEANEEGFVPISYLVQTSPVFAGLLDVPPQTVLVRCARASSVLEGRLVVSEPSSSTWFAKSRRNDAESEGGGGGFEVRRRDWMDVKDRLRKHTSFHWDSRTLYIENLPYRARNFHSVHEFIQDLLVGSGASKSGSLPIQSISFPRHQKDSLEVPPPTFGKGFAFVILSSAKDVDYLLERWPWELSVRSSKAEEGEASNTIQEAVEHGFRCLSKRKWDEMKEQYLALQRRLLEQTMAANNAGPSVPRLPPRNNDEIQRPQEENGRASRDEALNKPIQPDGPPAWYPKDCLVFIKNVHPETNKTTLRALFSSAFQKDAPFIDYVDYNKGLDSCYLRLSDPSNARVLVSYFSDRKTIQRNALDNDGVPVDGDGVIEVELVQGKKAELYWEKVPEKIRKAALAKAQADTGHGPSVQGRGDGEYNCSGRKRKRRERG